MQLTVRDVAKFLNVSDKSIYRWIEQGEMPACRVGGLYRFSRAEILEWATARRIKVSPDMLNEPESAHTPLPTLHEALKAGGIYYRIPGTNRETVLRSIVETIRLPEGVDMNFVFQVLLAREELGSTGIGDGIAIPHVRSPVIMHVTKPAISLCFLETPIDFGALDGKPVQTMFTIISPTARAHIHMLSRLSFTLRDPGLKEKLRTQASRDEILDAILNLEREFKSQAPAPQPEAT
jgi:nitrogen PTS system EIIA component